MEGSNRPPTSQIRKLGPPPLKKGSSYVNIGEEDQMVIICTLTTVGHLMCQLHLSTAASSYICSSHYTRQLIPVIFASSTIGNNRIQIKLNMSHNHMDRYHINTRCSSTHLPLAETLDASVHPHQMSPQAC